MAKKTIPGSVLNRRSLFPEGHFSGTISAVKDDKNPAGTIGSIAFQLINNEQLEDGAKDPGKRPHFVRIPVWMEVKNKKGKTSTLMTSEIDPEDDDIPFMLSQAVGQLGQLAVCLGQCEVAPDGSIDLDLEEFIESFRAEDGEKSDFDGEEVEFIVQHRRYKAKSGPNEGKTMTAVNTDFVVPEDEDETPEAEEEAPPKSKKDKKAKKSKGSGKAKFKRTRAKS